MAGPRLPRSASLNDRLRSTLMGGVVLLSNGVASLDDDAKRRLLAAVRTFEAFSPDNDPYGEHDFGAVEIGGEAVSCSKIDYHDRSLTVSFARQKPIPRRRRAC